MERRDGKSQHHPKADPVQKFEMQQRIWDMRRDHIPFREIGEALGISDKTAIKYFYQYQEYLIPPSDAQERILHKQQLEELMTEAARGIRKYNDPETKLKFMAELRALMKDYRRFVNIEGDKKVKHTFQSEFDAEMAALQDEFADFNARQEQAAQKEREQRRGRYR